MTFPILGANSAVSADAQARSLRFNQGDSPTLNKTFSSAGNQKTMTFSFWIKRSHLGDETYNIYAAGQDATSRDQIRFLDEHMDLIIQRNDYDYYRLKTNATFNSITSWVHFVIAIDTTQNTTSNRFKIYENGSLITSYSIASYPPLNLDLYFNENSAQYIGRQFSSNGNHYDGYLAEFHFIDGAQKTPSDFAETVNSVWTPKEYTGSYGTNGFKLDFSDTSSIGADSSGNGNDFSVSNLVSTDSVLDAPTNNFITWNPSVDFTSGTFTEGNTKVQTTNAQFGYTTSTITRSSGAWYAECYCTQPTTSDKVAVAKTTTDLTGGDVDIQYEKNGGFIRVNGTVEETGSGYGAGDIIGVAVDFDNETCSFYLNGTLQASAVSFSASGNYYIAIISDGRNSIASNWSVNYGQDSSFNGQETRQNNTDENGFGDFHYTPPSGYVALCGKNL